MQYAVAETSSATGGPVYGGRGQLNVIFYVYAAGADVWREVASSGGGTYVPFESLVQAGLDPQAIATGLGLEVDGTGSSATIYVGALGCNGLPGPGPCQETN